MEIRKLQKTDDPFAVSRIYEESWKSAYRGLIPQDYLDGIPAGQWVPVLAQEGRETLVLTENGTLIGASCICPSRWPDLPDYGEIPNLYLLPDYIGKGYGGPLLEAAVQALEHRGFRDVFLWVFEENCRARRFYEKHGFHPSGTSMETGVGSKRIQELLYCRHIE